MLKHIVNGMEQEMEVREALELEAEWIANEQKKELERWRIDREAAYLAKGWKDNFDIWNDASIRGMEAVLADRAAIIEQFPKA